MRLSRYYFGYGCCALLRNGGSRRRRPRRPRSIRAVFAAGTTKAILGAALVGVDAYRIPHPSSAASAPRGRRWRHHLALGGCGRAVIGRRAAESVLRTAFVLDRADAITEVAVAACSPGTLPSSRRYYGGNRRGGGDRRRALVIGSVKFCWLDRSGSCTGSCLACTL